MEYVFVELALVLFTAFIVSYLVRAFNQPIIIGYIIAGIVITFILQFGFVELSQSHEIIDLFSKFGIAFLLFMVGLHMNPKVIKEIGVTSFVIGLIQIVLTFALGFVVSSFLLGYGVITSLYIGIALAFSSTIIIMKLLSDKRQLDSLYGKISIGILIIQDLVAIAVLMIISSMSGGVDFGSFAIKGLLGGSGLIILLFLIGYFVLPFVVKRIAKSQELLFLFSVCWCFVIAALFHLLGLSIEIGALVAGVVLSMSPYSIEISSRVRPLRDFFLIIFFIILGLNIQITNLGSIVINALILSVLVLIFKPLVLMTFMAMFKYTKRNNFLVGTTLAQISEFSLIVLALGVAMGHISGEILSTLTLTAVITIALSTYMIIYSEKFYNLMSKGIVVFERKGIHKGKKLKKKYDAILFGYNRMGFNILRVFKKLRKKYLVIDFNPDTISDLSKLGIPCLYGDAYDTELLEELHLDKLDLGVSTIPDFETNALLIKTIKAENPKAIVVVRAHQIESALELYNLGADYVLTPHFLGGEYMAEMIDHFKIKPEGYKEEKIKHLKMLKKMMGKGHEHPHVEKD